MSLAADFYHILVPTSAPPAFRFLPRDYVSEPRKPRLFAASPAVLLPLAHEPDFNAAAAQGMALTTAAPFGPSVPLSL